MDASRSQALVWTGDIQVGEASSIAGKVRRLQTGLPWPCLFLVVLLPVGIFVGGITGAFLDQRWGYGWAEDAGMFGGLVLGAFCSLQVLRRVSVWRFRRRMQTQGFDVQLRQEVGVDADCLRYRVGGVAMTAEWSAVTHLVPLGNYWVVISQASPMYIPKRYFADKADEQRFVREVLDRATPAARARSSAAAAFAA